MNKINLKTREGFSIVEVLIVALLLSIVTAGGYMLSATGQSSWLTAGMNIQLEENLRHSLQRISMELTQTDVAQQQILNGAGPNNTDVIRFSVPITCQAGSGLLDANGDVAYWGAPLTWGCSDSSCMDADNNCATVDYKFVEYRINNNNQLVRRVLDGIFNTVTERSFTNQITDFQAVLNGTVINIQLTAQDTTEDNRVMSAQAGLDIFLRN